MLDKIIPPDDPRKVTNWRWFLTIAVAIMLLDTTAGRMGFMGFGSYALASDMQEQGEKIDRMLSLQISTILRDLKREHCRANGNKRTIELTIEDYQEQYKDVSGGKRYPLPACSQHDDDSG